MLVLFALCIPIILLFVGLALDLGWYYLNVSRLQNAADAAALAGANSLVKGEQTPFADYFVSRLSENRLPDDFESYADAYSHGFGTLTTIWRKPIQNSSKVVTPSKPTCEKIWRRRTR